VTRGKKEEEKDSTNRPALDLSICPFFQFFTRQCHNTASKSRAEQTKGKRSATSSASGRDTSSFHLSLPLWLSLCRGSLFTLSTCTPHHHPTHRGLILSQLGITVAKAISNSIPPLGLRLLVSLRSLRPRRPRIHAFSRSEAAANQGSVADKYQVPDNSSPQLCQFRTQKCFHSFRQD